MAPFTSTVPCFPMEHEIYEMMKKSKKTAGVPGDIPLRILCEFLPFFAAPMTEIICTAVQQGTYPSLWKMEYITPIAKVPSPETYDDLRPLSLTMFFSKKLEEFMLRGTPSVNGLLYYIEKHIDPNQFAVSGSSCTHALIRIIDFILKNTDDGLPRAVVNLLADWSKAFNKCNHNIFVKILITMNVPEWLLRLITSYLEFRKMVVRFRGVTSRVIK